MKALREWQTGTLDLSVALGAFVVKSGTTYSATMVPLKRYWQSVVNDL